jgi:hypothetical protein
MKDDVLQKAHLLYELEGGRLERLLEGDEVYCGVLARLERAERRLTGGDRKPAQAMAAARKLLRAMARAPSVKLGYVIAKDYPFEEIFKL